MSQTRVASLYIVGTEDHKKETPSADIPSWATSVTTSLLTGLQTVDSVTYSHCLRVGWAAKNLARSMGLSPFEQTVAEFSGLLHDIGKMGIESEVLHKPAALTDAEYKLVMSHPVLSERILTPLLKDNFFKSVAPGVRSHHERMDGKGYPDNLVGEQIPLMARVVLIVDTLDAMSQHRAYRKAMPLDLVYKELEKCAGTQFDKAIVKVFIESHKFWGPKASKLDGQSEDLSSALLWADLSKVNAPTKVA